MDAGGLRFHNHFGGQSLYLLSSHAALRLRSGHARDLIINGTVQDLGDLRCL